MSEEWPQVLVQLLMSLLWKLLQSHPAVLQAPMDNLHPPVNFCKEERDSASICQRPRLVPNLA